MSIRHTWFAALLIVLGLAGYAAAGAMCGSAPVADDADDACCSASAVAVAVADATTRPTTQPVAFACPMHPKVTSDKPGKCPQCGMTMEAPKSADQNADKTADKPAHDHAH